MNKTEFTAAVLAAEPTLYRVARSMLPCEADCADAAQNAILKAWERLHTLRRQEYFRTWLVRILINECRSMLRRRARFCALEPEGEGPAPERESYDELYEALRSLDGKYRLPVTLYYFEGFKTAEIAAMLNLSEGTVGTRLRRARELLREKLKGECFA